MTTSKNNNQTERAKEFLGCLGNGRSLIEIEQDEDYIEFEEFGEPWACKSKLELSGKEEA